MVSLGAQWTGSLGVQAASSPGPRTEGDWPCRAREGGVRFLAFASAVVGEGGAFPIGLGSHRATLGAPASLPWAAAYSAAEAARPDRLLGVR